MPYLSDYMKDKQTKAFEDHGAFFAFSNERFDKVKKEGVKYANMGAGMIAPVDKVESLRTALDTIYKEGIAQDIAENGIKKIIHRELGNYECQVTMDIDDVIHALKDYGITGDQIRAGWQEFWDLCVANDWF